MFFLRVLVYNSWQLLCPGLILMLSCLTLLGAKAAFIMYGRGGGGGGGGRGQVKFSNTKKILQLPIHSYRKKTSNPPQAGRKKQQTPPPHDGKMEVEVNDRKSDKKDEWEKYLYPFPKTERMVCYNKVEKDIP